MIVYGAFVTVPVVVYLTVPALHTVSWAIIGLAGVAAILTGVRLNRPARRWPWIMLACANLAFTMGDTAYNLIKSLYDEPNPFPSVADVFYLTTYPLFALGILGFIRLRYRNRDLPSLFDALILACGMALLCWVHLINPLSEVPGAPWTERAISLAYPLGDVLILVMVTRLLALGSLRVRSIQLLALGTLGILFSDIVYGLLQLEGTWQVGTPLDLGWVVFFTAWGMAGLHPSMVSLTERATPRPLSMTKGRVALLGGAALVAPGVLMVQALRARQDDSAFDEAVISAFSAVTFVLVLARLWGVVAEHRKAVARERGLRMAAASLVAAASREEVARAIEAAAAALVGSSVRYQVATLLIERGQLVKWVGNGNREETLPSTAGSSGERIWALVHEEARILPVERLGPELAARLRPLTHVVLRPLSAKAPSGTGPPTGALLLAAPEKTLDELSAALRSLAAQAALALARVSLSQEITRRNSEAYFRTLVHNASDVILILDDDDGIRYASPSAEVMFGRSLAGAPPLAGLVDRQDAERAVTTLSRSRDSAVDLSDQWRVRRNDGSQVEVEVRCSNLRAEETVRGRVLTLHDVTEQRQLERELIHRAFHDSLTDLPNRTLLMERTERALLRGRRDSTLTCMLFVDLDDFKVVNDLLGHSVGDELLVAIARRLNGTLRLSDTAARLGGDEFAILVEGARRPEDADRLAAQIVHALDRPVRLTGGTTTVSACIGVATARDSSGAEELLGHADLALYAAKSAGKRQWQRFRPDLHAGMAERQELRAGLEGAIADRSFALWYQPILDLNTGEVTAFEALARWRHARRGLVPPLDFISLAEETGHIVPLGDWVLDNAAGELAAWQRSHPAQEPLSLHVNVSPRQFRDSGFIDHVERTLATSGLVPGSLVLELTESVLMQHDEQIVAAMHQLKQLGVALAIDDFGTGFSSLSYLREFPIDVLKVDKSFIDNIATDGQQIALVEEIVRIADVLGLRVIAEGIENEGQRDLLTAIGCRHGQGFLFAPPVPAPEAERLLTSGTAGGVAAAQAEGPAEGGIETADGAVASAGAGAPASSERRWGDLARLQRSNPMCDAVIDEVRGRRLRSGDQWLSDFASCNYLGFDLDPEIMDAIDGQVRRWGTHPSWSRLIGNPRLYPEIEDRVSELLGAPDTLLLPTITLIHASVIPVLAGQGRVLVDTRAHRTVYDGAVAARGQGASLYRFHSADLDELDHLLRSAPGGEPTLVCIDGVNSMTGNIPDLHAIVEVCRGRDALLYVDDAHGFGIIGERNPTETSPYGSRGNCVVRHVGESYDNVILVGGFSKAYSSLLAFITAPSRLKEHLKVAAAPYLYSGPSPTASLATTLAGLDVNDRRGDTIRGDLYRKTARVLAHVRGLGLATPNADGLPIIEIQLVEASDIDALGTYLWQRGIYVTLAAYPLVPRHQVGFRIQVTAANTDEEIDELNSVLTDLMQRFPLKRAGEEQGPGPGPGTARPPGSAGSWSPVRSRRGAPSPSRGRR
ncbi:aminotransferase class I/II-fold pyridoxal phosphate-dependent enzyme [Streptomyces sp. NA04227]|nr:aminotransferase class I/II-fold pyridoxal phosphate-dependent enzyme [Streptomyces sp. NA04227]